MTVDFSITLFNTTNFFFKYFEALLLAAYGWRNRIQNKILTIDNRAKPFYKSRRKRKQFHY